jgi:hypothetical protein
MRRTGKKPITKMDTRSSISRSLKIQMKFISLVLLCTVASTSCKAQAPDLFYGGFSPFPSSIRNDHIAGTLLFSTVNSAAITINLMRFNRKNRQTSTNQGFVILTGIAQLAYGVISSERDRTRKILNGVNTGIGISTIVVSILRMKHHRKHVTP